MRNEVRVEIDTMQATITQLLQRQSHHSESTPENYHQQVDIVPPDITETPMTPSMTKRQKITAETNTKTNRWMQFLESPPTKLLLNHDYLRRY